MTDIDKLTASIKSHEGLRLLPYTDSTGHISIGWGVNLDAGITNEEADYLLGNRIRSAIGEAEAQAWWPSVSESDVRSRAMCEILFNMGLAKLNSFHDALGCLMQLDYDGASTAFLQSLWERQVGKRAEVLASMIKTGEDYPVA